MTRRIRRRLLEHSTSASSLIDLTSLPSDILLHILSLLNYRDHARLASTCLSLRRLAASPQLWLSLDLRPHRLDHFAALSLSSRCPLLQSLRFRGSLSASSIIHLDIKQLRHLFGDRCRELTDSTLAALAARHESLESLHLDPCVKITSDALRLVAISCNQLKRLRLSGIQKVDAMAINAFAKHCPVLEEVAFLDCGRVDETALGEVVSLRFLSVAGTGGMKWDSAGWAWSKLPNLVGLDVSRTDVSAIAVARVLSLSRSLKFMLALNCPGVEEVESRNPTVFRSKTKLLITVFSDVVKLVSLFFMVASVSETFLFGEFYNWNNKNKTFVDIKNWLEWMLSHSLLRLADSNKVKMDDFWLGQGVELLLSLFKSPQEEVVERAATALATFVVFDDDNVPVDAQRAEAVLRSGGIPLLLTLVKSSCEGVQSEAAKAIAHLLVNPRVAKAVADEGGIFILADLARSMNKYVAEEAAGGLWNLSIGEEHMAAIAESGGVKALVDLIFKWQSGNDGVLERAAGALANLAADDKCSIEVARAGGVHALVMLAKSCKVERVQEQTARALANLAAHGDNNSNNAAVGQEAGALEELVQLTCSQSESVRQEAAGALWNLSFNDRNREAIAAAGGVEALVALAQSCINSSPDLQERAAGALWGLSVSEANRIAIGNEGGVAPLIALVRSNSEYVHETAAGALWNLAFNSGNALRIVEEGGVPALVYLCSSSGSKMAKFMASLALSYMFDGRLDEVTLVGSSSERVTFDGVRKMALKHIEAFVLTFLDPQFFSKAVTSSTPAVLAQVAKSARIEGAGLLRCSGAEIGRFVTMLRNPSSSLRACAAFALFQFTTLGGNHTVHHAGLLKTAGAARVLRGAAAATTATLEVKIFARIVLRNLERLQFAAPL